MIKRRLNQFFDDIEGIGPARRKSLMKTFGSTEAVMQASVEELESAPSMNLKAAQMVYDFFHKKEE